jgi:predicted component of type VI protein secretion system
MIANTLSLPKLIKIENSDTITEKSVFKLFKQSELLNEMRYNLLKPENFGIIKFEIDKNAQRKGIFKISEIECIFSNGSEYYHKATSLLFYSIDIKNLNPLENDGAYIFITINDYNLISGNLEYQSPNQKHFIRECINSENSIYTIEKNINLVVANTPPSNCGFLPIAKLKLSKNGLELDDYNPPVFNIKSDQKIIAKLESSMELINNKFLMVKKDIEDNKSELNPKKYHDHFIKIKHLSNSLNMMEQVLNEDQILPKDFYLILNKIFANVISINPNINLPKLPEFKYLNIEEYFTSIMDLMNEILNKEISEKYKLYLFTKKDNLYYLKLPKQSSSIYKIALKKPARVSDAQLMEWLHASLICEKNEYHFMIEKRSLGYERKHEHADIEINLKNEYLFFNVKLAPDQSLNDNTLVISQSSSKYNLFEPDAIVLYWEMKG